MVVVPPPTPEADVPGTLPMAGSSAVVAVPKCSHSGPHHQGTMDSMEIPDAARPRGVTSIKAVSGDLTAQDVDALVNAANEHLAHGGGVAAAITRAGGPTIQRESDAWVATHGPLVPGVAAVTSAGAMTARWG